MKNYSLVTDQSETVKIGDLIPDSREGYSEVTFALHNSIRARTSLLIKSDPGAIRVYNADTVMTFLRLVS